MFRALGNQDVACLLRLCIWLAPSLYTVEEDGDQGNIIFAGTDPLDREYVSFSTEAAATDNTVTHVGEYMLITKNGTVRIEDGTGYHVGTVNQGRWRRLATVSDQKDLIRALPGWISQVQAEERSVGVPSHQLWQGIRAAFNADVIVGCCPLTAPACFKAALCGRGGHGWGHHETKTRKVFNMLCMPPDIMRAIVARMRPETPWVALTRDKTLTEEAQARLERVGTRIFAWSKGAMVAASTGAWRKGQIRSIQSREEWSLWISARTDALTRSRLAAALSTLTLTRDGAVPLDTSCPSFREAQLGPAGPAMNHPGVVVATDGAVKSDGRMGAAYVSLGDRLPARSFVVLGPPSAMRAELSALDQAVADAPADEDLTILTDSLTSLQKLQNLQRRDWPEWLHGHPEQVLLESLVVRLNERARKQVLTRLVKVQAHKGHPLNERADAAASRAAMDTEVETAMLCHADSKAVRFVLENRLVTEWGAGIRRALTQVAAKQVRNRLIARLRQDSGSDARVEQRRQGQRVSLAAQWLLRQEEGRAFLGSAMADLRYGAKRRRIMQTIAGVFPCQALLHKWGKAASPQCLLCGGGPETISHIQNWCPALKDARISAHHALAAMIFTALQAHSTGRWQLHRELTVGSLRAIQVPLDLLDTWNNMVDALEEPGDDTHATRREHHHPQDLSRLRPDAIAISWSKRQVLLLELTRAYDWRQDWYEATDAFKTQRYKQLQERMLGLLPRGWVVETIPLTIGIRGSLHEPTWRRTLDRLGCSSQVTQTRFLQ